MKKILLSITCLALTLGAQAQIGNYAVGEVVDDFTVTDINGETHNLYTITASGKHVYLDFFFDTCVPCQGASPTFGEFYDKYGCNSGDVYCIVMNNGTDNDAATAAYEETYGGPGHHAPAVSADGGAGAVDAAFGVGAYPTFCMIGPDNKLINGDIWPLSGVETFEATFYGSYNPSPMSCSLAGIEENTINDLTIYPNPAFSNTTIVFSSESDNEATITVMNLLGELIQTNLVSVVSGTNSHVIDVQNFDNGNYFVQIQMNDKVYTTKLEVIK